MFGEYKAEDKRNSIYRVYRVGNDKVQEKTQSDHVGFKAITNREYSERIIDKVKMVEKPSMLHQGLG